MALTEKLSAIGDAIREKTGGTELLKLDEMPAAIEGISGGSGGYVPTDEDLTLTGDCQYEFANNKWNWVIDNYGDKITTNGITNAECMFNEFSGTNIPFDLNVGTKGTKCSLSYLFKNNYYLTEPPKIRGNVSNLAGIFWSCIKLKKLPEDYFSDLDFSKRNNSNDGYMYYLCYKLENPIIPFPGDLEESTAYYFYSYFYNGFSYCYRAKKLINLPIPYAATWTSNSFQKTFYECWSLGNLTFLPYTKQWKSQVIDMTKQIGYGLDSSVFDDVKDKRVIDDATYQSLKNDPDWWTADVAYSRYNHDSAVETINSLPDTSAYLATAGGTNTIKFKGEAGSKTDGGAINTMTEEEIAVATAKGWTVSFV